MEGQSGEPRELDSGSGDEEVSVQMREGFICMKIEEICSKTTTDKSAQMQLISYYVAIKRRHFLQTRHVKDLEEAVKKQHLLLQLNGNEGQISSEELIRLSDLLKLKYERTRQVQDLQSAIEKAEEAVELMPTDHPNRSGWLNNLGNMLESRYQRTGQIQDLQSAIKKMEEAVELTPTDHPNWAGRLNNLGNMLGQRYERIGQIQDLQLAIERAEKMLELMPIDQPNRAVLLNNLGHMLGRRYERTGQIEDLQSAIKKAEKAVELTPTGHPNQAVLLNNLGIKLGSQYERTVQIEDLQSAIKKVEEAIKLTPTDHPNRAAWLNNLGNMLRTRYEHTGQNEDLQSAIEKVEEAIKLTPTDHPDRAVLLNSLVSILGRRYERTRQMEDLQSAIKQAEKAVELTPTDHSNWAGCLNNLGNMLWSRYKRTGQIEDLQSAIKKAEKVMKLAPTDHPDRAGWLNNLANKLESRYERTRRIEDLQSAIEKAEEAVELTPTDHFDRAGRLSNLGWKQLLSPHSIQTGKALTSFLHSWRCLSGIPSHRLASAVAAVNLLVQNRSWGEATNLAVDAVHLLPIMNRRFLARDDQQHLLSRFSGLAAKACSLLLQNGRPVSESVEILELGRGAILGLMIDDRRDISRLQHLSPPEFDEYDYLRRELNSDISDTTVSIVSEPRVKDRSQVVKRLEECIGRIRLLPGLERFLLGSSTEELQQQARVGPIVIINVTDIRSDAIIVGPRNMTSINLPAFSADALRSWKQQNLTKFGKKDFRKKNKAYRAFLSWIWEVCVHKVVDQVTKEFTHVPGVLPQLRVWWIGAGEASDVAFHAAGYHTPGSLDNTLSHVISSYTPTIKALEFSRERLTQARPAQTARGLRSQHQKFCLVTMPHTPGAADLPGVLNERSSIEQAIDSRFSITRLPSPTASRVKEELQSCHIFHFAGHGTSDSIDPSQGSIVLQKYDNSRQLMVQDLLSVGDVSRLHLPHAELAYLSACSTAENNTGALVDEVIHLVSGFQVAGFADVIGAMWPSADDICTAVARLFYQNLCEKENSVAQALHAALMKVRDTSRLAPLTWAQYVHFGV